MAQGFWIQPACLRGKHMRHVKLRPEVELDEEAVARLIDHAYENVRYLLSTPRR